MNDNLPQQSKYCKEQQGFTLIELMISLVLGLLISAAVIQVFITSQRVDRMQTAGSEVQDKAVFGLQSIEPQIRLANLGNNGAPITDTTAMGGIVLTVGKISGGGDDDDDDDASSNANIMLKNNLKNGYLTRSHDMQAKGNRNARWDGSLTNTDVNSDQLTIQYTNTTGRRLYDCEGKDIDPGEHVVARYFITKGTIKTRKDRENLNLNCESGRVINERIRDFGRNGTGVTIIENIDQFNIRLGIQKSVVTGGALSYQYADMTVKDYMALSGTKPNITNVRLAILARSNANSPNDSAETFVIFGENQTLKPQADAPKHLRRVYESNILLRNARVIRTIDSSSAPQAESHQ